MQPPSGVARLLTGSLLIITLLAPTLSRPGYTTPAGDTFNILTLVPYAANFNIVSAITHHGNERLFVAELIGQIRVVTSSGYILPTPFLDITDRVSSAAGEQGLLGLVFHPDPDRSHFYLLYTNLTGDATLSRFQVSASDPNLADPNSELIMLTVPQPTPLHNGGALAFGPDGYLYVGLGDGGRDGDPDLFSQDPNNLLGTILRLDVDSSLPYAIPPDNPFVGNPAGRDEVWA
ncbi:MAG: PQQ-dependent sugar dehydrogenase, partial [Anaerolineales bacterium]|nr:PQQ-dependent sugar dehydrogenase [Anaerolineales bacterium]